MVPSGAWLREAYHVKCGRRRRWCDEAITSARTGAACSSLFHLHPAAFAFRDPLFDLQRSQEGLDCADGKA